MIVPRRTLLAGLATSMVSPVRAGVSDATSESRLHAVLDHAGQDPGAGLAALSRFDAEQLPASARLDLLTARAGLAIDVERARLGPSADPVAAYALRLRRTTGDRVDPARLRARMERERTRVLARANFLFTRIGLPSGTTGERYSTLWRDSRRLYADDDGGRARAIDDMNRWLAAAFAWLAHWFGPLPPEVGAVRAMRMPAVEEAGGKQGYRIVPEPGRPGRYVVDLREIQRRPSWTLPAVVHHELLPGHMVQLPLEAHARPHPLRLDYAQSFAEGWAIYAEGLAAAAGLYRGDPHGELGFCHWRLFRLCRAQADLALHLGGSSRATVLADWRSVLGEPAYFAPFEADLDRIARDPAARAAEAAMWLAIEDRAGARPARSFHRSLLQHGRMRIDAFP